MKSFHFQHDRSLKHYEILWKTWCQKIDNKAGMESFLKKMWIIKTDKEEIESLKKHIPSKETDIATEYLLTKKSPDSDGFTSELY